ncbi:helix-turn-helix domain-containing protein [Halobaculum litoreum]|uniref:Helix-turn-helix domain-containing protein n=1 Tax=Halobaculum litoreum TaxID=3031998 RepID=A0ABD5XUA3_9EURY
MPRAVTLEELGDRLGISDTAASQRLRRGITALLTESLDRPRQAEGEPDRP